METVLPHLMRVTVDPLEKQYSIMELISNGKVRQKDYADLYFHFS